MYVFGSIRPVTLFLYTVPSSANLPLPPSFIDLAPMGVLYIT